MIETKLYIDFGTGYELIPVNSYGHDFVITSELEDQVRLKKKLSGSIIIKGSLFDTIYNLLNDDFIIELPIKIELNDILQGEFYMSLLAEYNHTEKKATFSNYRTNDVYSKIEAQFDIQRIPFIFAFNSTLKVRENSTDYNNVTVENNIPLYSNYILTYDVEGVNSGIYDARWTHFSFLYTEGVSAGVYKHYFVCNTITLEAPGSLQYTLNLQKNDVVISLPQIWIFNTYNPLGYTNDTSITTSFTNLYSVLSWFTLAIPEIGLNLPVCNYIDLEQISIADVSRIFVSDEPEETLTLSINDICNYLKNRFQLDWFINDDGSLEFLHPSEFGTVGTIDISAKDTKNKIDTYFRDSLPKFERMVESNAFFPDFDNSQTYIEYARNTADEIKYEASKFCHDIGGMLRNPSKVERKTFFIGWLTEPRLGVGDAIIPSGTGIISGIQVINNNMSMSYLFANHWLVWRYAKKATINGVLETVGQRPIFAHAPIQYRSTLPTDIDLLKLYTTSNGDYLGMNYSYNLKSNIGILNLIK